MFRPVRLSLWLPLTLASAGAFAADGAPPEAVPAASRPSLRVCARAAEIPGTTASAGSPIAGATVILIAPDGHAQAGTAASDGCADFTGLAAGTWKVTVTSPGTQPSDGTVEVGPDGGATFNANLALISADGQEVVVEADREQPGETRRTLSPSEVRNIPGAANDALKSVQNMPGVARAPFGAGLLVVRGAAPGDTRVYLDGEEIPQLYHFGGLQSVFATEAISRIDFLPGGFGVRYGRSIGGVVDVETRPGREDRHGGLFDANMYDAGGMVEGPSPLGRGRYLAAARRSYIDTVLPLVAPGRDLSFTVAPRYYDYQMRYDLAPGEDGTMAHLMAYGSDDAFTFVLKKPSDDGLRGRYLFRTAFHRIQAPITKPVGSGWMLSLVPAVGYQDLTVDGGGLIALQGTRFLGSVRAEVRGKLSDRATLLAGFDGQTTRDAYDVNYADDANSGAISPDRRLIASDAYGSAQGGVYAETEFHATDRLTLVPGLRADGYLPAGAISFDPRIAGRYTFNDASFAKGYVGLYHQPPEFYQWDPRLGNSHLRPAQAIQAGFGGGHRYGETMSVEGEAFYKWLSDLPVETIGNPEDPTARTTYSNDGIGRVYGVEGLAKRELSEKLSGWVSYTISKSERASPYSGGWKPFYLDQTHILTTVASYQLERNWTIGARFRYVTGDPTTVVDEAVYDADQDRYYPVPGFRHVKRLPPFNQLDVRVDKRWEWSGWTLDGYLDVQNVYNQMNPERLRYDFDYRQSAYVSGIPVFPSIGVRGEF